MSNVKIPADTQSEFFLIARMLASVNAANDAITALQSEDFHDPRHRVIFDAMRSLYAKDCEIEPLAVATQLSKSPTSDQIDISYLFNMRMYEFGNHSEVKIFIDNILEASRLRKLISIGNFISSQAFDTKKTSEEIHIDSLTKMEGIFTQDFEKGVYSMPDLLKKDYAEDI